MADLRVPQIDNDLMARLKSGAALAQITLREFVVRLLTDALTPKRGKKARP